MQKQSTSSITNSVKSSVSVSGFRCSSCRTYPTPSMIAYVLHVNSDSSSSYVCFLWFLCHNLWAAVRSLPGKYTNLFGPFHSLLLLILWSRSSLPEQLTLVPLQTLSLSVLSSPKTLELLQLKRLVCSRGKLQHTIHCISSMASFSFYKNNYKTAAYVPCHFWQVILTTATDFSLSSNISGTE